MNELEKRNDQYTVLPPVDIYETKNEYILKLDMPGVRREDVSIMLKDGRLEVTGSVDLTTTGKDGLRHAEFSLENYRRLFTVGHDVDPNGVSAKIENGVVAIELRKREEAKPRKIEVIAS